MRKTPADIFNKVIALAFGVVIAFIIYAVLFFLFDIITAKTTLVVPTIAPQVAKVRSAVVHIRKTYDERGDCQGSGCLISADGILFTAKHITDGDVAAKYTVTLDDGQVFPVKYALEDRENDVAFMLLDRGRCTADANLPFVPLAGNDSLRSGDFVFIMGSPLI